MLSRFEVLDDKRGGRCWSPTRYADGASSRSNDGVCKVSATAPGTRSAALNRAEWTLWSLGRSRLARAGRRRGRALRRGGVHHLLADDGERQSWATTRSGLSAGLQQPIDLDAER
jgi:hypothetical protein